MHLSPIFKRAAQKFGNGAHIVHQCCIQCRLPSQAASNISNPAQDLCSSCLWPLAVLQENLALDLPYSQPSSPFFVSRQWISLCCSTSESAWSTLGGNLPFCLPAHTHPRWDQNRSEVTKKAEFVFQKACSDNRRILLWKSLSMSTDACLHIHSLGAQLWGEVLQFATNTVPGLTFSPAWVAGAQGQLSLCSQGARACPPPGQTEELPLREGNSGRFAGGCRIINECKIKLMVITGEAQGVPFSSVRQALSGLQCAPTERPWVWS